MSPMALIIDDSPNNLDALAALLHREGVACLSVESPGGISEALENSNQVDIVFLDLEFPNYNGLDLIADLRHHPLLESVPIVAYTVHVSEQNEARDAGFHSFIGKPLSVERFPGQLHRISSGERVWDAV